ncbi:MAG: hypothetical protein EBZ74_11430, partial [Planctomycetia bacterium]|nr:hypothetical protein [Planctomycetia bacterium]
MNAGVVALSGVGTLGATTNSLVLGGGSLDLGGLSGTAGNVSLTSAATGNQISNGTLTSSVSSGTAFNIANSSGTATITAILAGSGAGLTKTGGGVLVLGGSNTFTGPVSVTSGGIVSVATIGNAGAAGNLGAAANISGTAPIRFTQTNGSFTNSLIYTGAGETTDRNVTLDYGNNVAAAILANGSGNLTLTGAFNMTSKNSTNGAAPLILAGTSTGANTLTGDMTEAGGNKISVSKQDTGTWVLSGIRNYSAVTDVRSGLLQFDSIANAGVASALGTGASPYAVLPSTNTSPLSSYGTTRIPYQIALGGTATSGTLEYIGVGSGSSNRSFGFNNNGTLSAASGAGTLSLSGTFAPAASTNVAFTLAAANSGTNTISGVIANLAAASTTANATASGANQISVASSAGFSIGQTLTGAGIAANSIITGISTGTLFLSQNTTASLSAGTSLSAAGGTMSLAKTGPGTWALSGTNTYTGPTTVSGGRLVVSAGNINASNGITLNGAGAELRYNSAT